MSDTIEESRSGCASRHPGQVVMAVPESPSDFDRAIVSILGLPFDAISLRQAVQQIRRAAFSGRRCFVSTSNLNFAMSARTDSSFRGTVLRSDLNLIDGMPLVWVARMLGLPVSERVAGSDLFEALQAHAGPPIKVYLFGGPPGTAKQAFERINRRGGGIQCVGYDEGGFGSVESMSGSELIGRINSSGAQFVLVSLGAKKGQAWLEHNESRLTSPVLSHLGAVMNFAAGTVRRAPRRMRWLGLEWLWRIKEEPGLWRRYWQDGSGALSVLLNRVLPDVFASRARAKQQGQPGSLIDTRSAGIAILSLDGSWQDRFCAPFRRSLADCAADGVTHVAMDLSGVTDVGDTFVALCLLARGRFSRFRVQGAGSSIAATFHRKLADHLLQEGKD